MYDMCMSCCTRCTCRDVPHAHLVQYQMCMSYIVLHRDKRDTPGRKAVSAIISFINQRRQIFLCKHLIGYFKKIICRQCLYTFTDCIQILKLIVMQESFSHTQSIVLKVINCFLAASICEEVIFTSRIRFSSL